MQYGKFWRYVVYIPVVMVMPEEPLLKPGILPDFLQVSGGGIRPVPCAAQQNLRTGGAAVGLSLIHI